MAQETMLEQISKMVGRPVSMEQLRDSEFRLKVTENGDYVAAFCLNQLDGCCGVCVSYHAGVSMAYRNRGIGSLLNQMRQQIAWNWGYTVILCTDRCDNECQEKILSRNAWDRMMTFCNRRTGNDVSIYAKNLSDLGFVIGAVFADYHKES